MAFVKTFECLRKRRWIKGHANGKRRCGGDAVLLSSFSPLSQYSTLLLYAALKNCATLSIPNPTGGHGYFCWVICSFSSCFFLFLKTSFWVNVALLMFTLGGMAMNIFHNLTSIITQERIRPQYRIVKEEEEKVKVMHGKRFFAETGQSLCSRRINIKVKRIHRLHKLAKE